MARPAGPRSYSFVAIAAMVLCTVIFVAGQVTDLPFRFVWSFRPALVADVLERGVHDAADVFTIATIWLSLLVHGDVAHLLSNLAFLWFFGALLAQVAGERWVFLALLLTPIGSDAAAMLHEGEAAVRYIGISGAISGLGGLYVLLAFRWKLPDVYTWPLSRPVRPGQAALVAVFGAAMDIFVLQSGANDGIARDAHLGGFAAGLLLGAILTSFFPTAEAFGASIFGPRRRSSASADRADRA